MKSFTTYILLIIFCTSCTTVTENDLLEPVEETVSVTYTNTVKSIIETNCIVCHDDPPLNGAPMPLLTYSNVKDAIENRGLIDRISSTDLNFLMPFGGPRLPQTLIDQIVQWQEDGLLEE